MEKIKNYSLLFFVSILIFCLFLPAVFVRPEYLLKGVSQFAKGEFAIWLILAAGLIFAIQKLRPNWIVSLMESASRQKRNMLLAVSCIFLVSIFALLLNVWLDQRFAPLDELKDTAYAKEPKNFNFGNLLANDNFLEKNAKLFMMEMYPFVFSLTPLVFLLTIFAAFKMSSRKQEENNYLPVMAAILLFFIFYFTLTIYAKVVTNARYSILLFPLFSLLAGVAASTLIDSNRLKKRNLFRIFAIFFLVYGLVILWISRPFYFSYTSLFLPAKFSIHDSWGHGFYEAAQYLNSLPKAENQIIRSNSNTICPFLKGKCLKSRKIDIARSRPDYFVLSKRGALKERNHFMFINAAPEKDSAYYFEKMQTQWSWAVFINNRPENFVKILKYEN